MKTKHYSMKEIWERCEKRTLTVQIARPQIESEDGSIQGITCFRAYCTDVHEEGNETSIGSIGGAAGFVTLDYKEEEWLIKHSDLWYAFMEALGFPNADNLKTLTK